MSYKICPGCGAPYNKFNSCNYCGNNQEEKTEFIGQDDIRSLHGLRPIKTNDTNQYESKISKAIIKFADRFRGLKEVNITHAEYEMIKFHPAFVEYKKEDSAYFIGTLGPVDIYLNDNIEPKVKARYY